MRKKQTLLRADPEFIEFLEQIKKEEQKSYRLITRDLARNLRGKRRRRTIEL